jgi:hypothetical protein
MSAQTANLLPIVLIVALFVVVFGFRMRRMSQMRPLRLELMWIMPAILAVMLAGTLYAYRPVASDWLWIAVAALLGAAVGWYRGRMMQIHVDPKTHALNQKASPAAIIFIVALLIVRRLLNLEASTMGLKVNLITDASLAFAAAMFSAVRVEMFLRAQRLLAEARAGGPPTASA